MSNRPYNSIFESILVQLHRFIAHRQNVFSELVALLYPWAYFAYKRFQDRALVAAMRRLIRPGTLVLDIGANIGFFSFAVLDTDASCSVLAFEPAPDNFRQFTALIAARHERARPYPYPIALSDQNGTALLHLSDLAPTDHKLFPSRSSKVVEIATQRFDDFLDQHPQWLHIPVSLVKIDVQGAELMVLQGMARTLEANQYPPILVEYSPADLAAAGVTPDQFFDAFASLGYQPHSLPMLAPLTPNSLSKGLRGAYTDVAMLSARQR